RNLHPQYDPVHRSASHQSLLVSGPPVERNARGAHSQTGYKKKGSSPAQALPRSSKGDVAPRPRVDKGWKHCIPPLYSYRYSEAVKRCCAGSASIPKERSRYLEASVNDPAATISDGLASTA